MGRLTPEVQALLDSVALGTASEPEIRRAESLALADAEVGRELDDLRAAVSGLALAVPQYEPQAELKRAIMAEIRDTTPAAAPRREARRPRWRFELWPSLAVAASLVAVGLFAWNVVVLDSGGDTAIDRTTISGTADAPGASAEVSFLEDEGTVLVRATGLPGLAAGQAYELWFIGAGGPVSAGFLSADGAEHVIAASAEGADVDQLAITPEPRDNTAAPTGPIVLQADFPIA